MKRTIKLTESDLKQIIKESVNRILKEDSLDDEMLIWKKRSESEFGKTISQLNKLVGEMYYDEDEYGLPSTPISHYVTAYSLDGDMKYTAKIITDILTNYDMLGQGDKIDFLVKKMNKLSQINQ